MLLLTWHGTLVCLRQNGGGLLHLPIGAAAADTAPLDLDIGRAPPESPTRLQSILGPLTVAAALNARISLARYGQYLSAAPDGSALAFDAADADALESFLPVTQEQVAILAELAAGQWIDRESRAVLRRGGIAALGDFRLRVGAFELDLEATWPARIGPPDSLAGFRLSFGGGGTMELVRAEPRSSSLLETQTWPPRARRVAEIVVLAAHRQVAGREPEQDVFDRDVAEVLAQGGPQALDPLLARLLEERQPEPPAQGPSDGPDVEDVLLGWALAQTAPWAPGSVDPRQASEVFAAWNATTRVTFIVHIQNNDARLEEKPADAGALPVETERAERYVRFLQAVARRLPPEFATTLCICTDDLVGEADDIPIFGFQKRSGERQLLLPDVDLLDYDFFEDGSLDDTTGYFDKSPGAVFAGATSGGWITPDIARTLDLPRLRAAAFFDGHDRVDFRLPNIVQCLDGAEDILREKPFCQRPVLSWEEQLRSRLLISMDGNGATCARVAIALRSNAALLKYDSPFKLFYFPGLQPWLHYIPVAADEDIDIILAQEAAAPETFARIAENGRRFAQTYLTRDAAERYTALLLERYATLFADAESLPVPTQRATPGQDTAVLVHMQERADVEAPAHLWVGEPGSGLAIEGLAVFFGANTPAEALSYQVLLDGGALSAPAADGEFLGSRGRGSPLYGFSIAVTEAAAPEVEIEYEASFTDGTRAGPCAPGTLCASPNGAPLEALRIAVRGLRPQTAAPRNLPRAVGEATAAFGRANPPSGTSPAALMATANAALAEYRAATGLLETFSFAFQPPGPPPRHSAVIDISDDATIIAIDPAHTQPWMLMWRGVSVVYLLEAMLAWAPLAATSFPMDLGDGTNIADVAAFCSANPSAFLLPDPEFIGSGGYHAERVALARTPPPPWEQRRPVAFWRGATTGRRRHAPPPEGAPDDFTWLPRLDLCARARRSPLAGAYDVGIAKFVQLNNPALHARIEAAGLTRPAADRAAFAQCRAILVIDGNTNAWSALFRALLSGACVLRVESPHGFRQWYYDDLKPWVHYVPVRADLADMDDAVAWVMANDDAARQIGQASQALAQSMTFDTVLATAAQRLRAWLEK